jgi:hypothetical protein
MMAIKPKNRAQRLEEVLVSMGHKATLGCLILEIEARGYMDVRHRFSAAASELRADLRTRPVPHDLRWTRGATPALGLYEIIKLDEEAEVEETVESEIVFCALCNERIFTRTSYWLPDPFKPQGVGNMPMVDQYCNGIHSGGGCRKSIIQEYAPNYLFQNRDTISKEEAARRTAEWSRK